MSLKDLKNSLLSITNELNKNKKRQYIELEEMKTKFDQKTKFILTGVKEKKKLKWNYLM